MNEMKCDIMCMLCIAESIMRKQFNFEVYLDDFNTIIIYRKKGTFREMNVAFYMECNHKREKLNITNIEEDKEYFIYRCILETEIVLGREYIVINEAGREAPLVFSDVVKTDEFDNRYYYDGNDLGATYTKNHTDFKVWAPTAYDMKLELYRDGNVHVVQMQRQEKGIYYVRIEGNLKTLKYTFLVSVNGQTQRSLDPYAKAVDVNSRHNVIIDIPQTDKRFEQLVEMESYCDAIIYELSVRDFTSGKTYVSFMDTSKEDEGFNYLKSLGITHVQFMPLLDYCGVNEDDVTQLYNWGYDANMYMALENTYGSDPYNQHQTMKEFQEVVQLCHDSGMRVTMDVIFNHVFEAGTSCLEKLVPNYYFQMTSDHYYSNATMCGNDIDSKRRMCSKLLVDAAVYLLETYDIDGLRFDLMGILDTKTMNEIAEETQKRKADFMLYGEGWNMPSTLVEQERASIQNNWQTPEIAYFSDVFRDTIRGSKGHNYIEQGYALGNTTNMYKAMNVLGASVGDFGGQRIFATPSNVVNYVECHDNMTSWDVVDLSMNESDEEKEKRHKMMLAFVLLSQGIPFIHSGQEFMRTKRGEEDTYNMGDEINHLDYERKNEHLDTVQYVRDLIEIRKNHKVFRKTGVEDVHQNVYYEHLNDKAICYRLHSKEEELMVVFNPTQEWMHKHESDEWELLFHNGKSEEIHMRSFDVGPLDVMVLKKLNIE